jgi:hypothetical protein
LCIFIVAAINYGTNAISVKARAFFTPLFIFVNNWELETMRNRNPSSVLVKIILKRNSERIPGSLLRGSSISVSVAFTISYMAIYCQMAG